MSARTDLAAQLSAALPAGRYRIVGAPDVPDGIEPGTYAIRVWQTETSPGPALGSLTLSLVMWVLTGKVQPGDADDHLDAALSEVLEVLHPLEWVRWTQATRGIMTNDDTSSYHGWRFDLTAFARITLED